MWLVCQHKKTGDLFIQRRIEREQWLSVLIDAGKEIPTRVIEIFDELIDAKKYVANQQAADILIKNALKD